jgi:hypothetical protein
MINSFGFGEDHDPRLMTSISNLKDGNFYFIQQLNTLDECFVDALGGLVSVVAEKITINVLLVINKIIGFLQGLASTQRDIHR